MMPRNLGLITLHRALEQGRCKQEAMIAKKSASEDTSKKILQAVTVGPDKSHFHETLHKYSMFARPTSVDDLTNLACLVTKLFHLCGTSKDAWKVLCLTICLRRYHEKAPEARKLAEVRTISTEEKIGASHGDGERLIFYCTLLTLQRCWISFKNYGTVADEDKHLSCKDKLQETFVAAENACKTAATLIRLAARIGGSRDLCAIIEHLTTANLLRSGHLVVDADATEYTPDRFADKLVPALLNRAIRGQPGILLELAVKLAAEQLDNDLRLVSEYKESENKYESGAELLSTIHVMLPHNGRGSNTKGGWKRKLANAVAEILIWRQTEVGRNDPRFTKSMEKLQMLSETSIDQAHILIQQLQTTIRKKRQFLNSHARQHGFLLTSAYLLDKTNLTLRQIRRAKAGDLKMLERIVRKHRDIHTLKLIAKRHLDPSKATTIASISDLCKDWNDIDKPCGDDEVAELELALQANTVQATLDKIRSSSVRPAWVTCLDCDRDNLLCAILVAASLNNGRLYLDGTEHDVSTTEKCITLLNQVILHDKFRTESLVKTEDLLSQKVGRSEDVLVVSARDLELDESVLRDMQEKDITIRVHATKRVESVGKVTLALNDTIYERIKARQFLTLGVMLDCTGSMGSEIEGCKKGALELIANFRDLAPVNSFNFMGYWDPVNVRSDPQPKSTGYLEANKNNMSILQEFVNKELRCQGGGDEPEDIPKALEAYLKDMKNAGLSANDGVHFLFFIADAGFRPNETARVRAALEGLRKLGIVLVMCRVRGGSNLQTFVSQASSCFQDVGQYVELSGVGQLAAIAASVTESIRASLFRSDVKSVTASVGSTIDVLHQLTRFQIDHKSLKETEDLTMMSDEEAAEEDEEEVLVVGVEVMAKKREPKVFAEKKELSLTSRDRLYLQLSRLPPLCHDAVAAAFGGKTLQEMSAALIADRLHAEKIPLSEIQKAGYPNDIVDLVKNLMGGNGIKRVEA